MPEEDTRTGFEVATYQLLQPEDVDAEPPPYRPLGPGDVFDDIELGHLATPITATVIVVGHPCSLRRGLNLLPDIPVAPIVPRGIPTDQRMLSDRWLPVDRLLPPGSSTDHAVDLSRTTTVAATRLDVAHRCATLGNDGIIALQQRVVGNAVRVRVPPGTLNDHSRGPLVEIELWTNWREACIDHDVSANAHDGEFDRFMQADSGDGTDWRTTIGARESAKSRAVVAMDAALSKLFAD